MSDRNQLIEQAIAQCEKDKAVLDAQLAQLRSALKPVPVPRPKKLNGAPKPKDKPSRAAPAPSAEEIQLALNAFDKSPLALAEVVTATGLSKAKTRACLDALVENGDVVAMGNRRSLRFLLRGVEFEG